MHLLTPEQIDELMNQECTYSEVADAEAALWQEKVQEIEYKLDETNARYGSDNALCIYCHSAEYNSVDGIAHKPDCIISKLRQALKAEEK